MKKGKCQVPVFLLSLVLSASLVVIPKIIFSYEVGSKSKTATPFEKPLFLTLLVFLGMTLALPVFQCLRWIEYRRQKKRQQEQLDRTSETTTLLGGSTHHRVYDPYDAIDPQWQPTSPLDGSSRDRSSVPSSKSPIQRQGEPGEDLDLPSPFLPSPFSNSTGFIPGSGKSIMSWKLFLLMLIPTLFDLSRQILFFHGILLLSTTWFQISRSTMFIFTACIRFILTYSQHVRDSQQNGSSQPSPSLLPILTQSSAQLQAQSSLPSSYNTDMDGSPLQPQQKRRGYCFSMMYSGVSICMGTILLSFLFVFFFIALVLAYSNKSADMLRIATTVFPLTKSFWASPVFVGILLILASNFIETMQFLFEEKVISFDSVPPLVVIGTEGVWGTILMILVVLPLAQWVIPPISSSSNSRSFEDTIGTIRWLSSVMTSSPAIPILMVLVIVLALGYNITAILTSTLLSPTNHARLDAIKPMGMVLGGLLGYYLLDGVMGQPINWMLIPELFTAFKLYYAVMLISGAITLPSWIVSILRRILLRFSSPSHRHKVDQNDHGGQGYDNIPTNSMGPTATQEGQLDPQRTDSLSVSSFDSSITSDLGETLLGYNIPLREAPPLTVRLCPGPAIEWDTPFDEDNGSGFSIRSWFGLKPTTAQSSMDDSLFAFYDDFSPTLLGTLIYGNHHTFGGVGDLSSPLPSNGASHIDSDRLYGYDISSRVGNSSATGDYHNYFLGATDSHSQDGFRAISPFIQTNQGFPPTNPRASYGSML